MSAVVTIAILSAFVGWLIYQISCDAREWIADPTVGQSEANGPSLARGDGQDSRCVFCGGKLRRNLMALLTQPGDEPVPSVCCDCGKGQR